MPADAEPRSKHAPADQKYLDSLSARQLMDFRNYLFNPTYIAQNAAKFLDHEWVDIGELRKYLHHTVAIAPPTRVKLEAMAPFVTPEPAGAVKTEPDGSTVPQAVPEIKLRALNVFELLSDSDSEPDAADSDVEVIATLQPNSRSSSVAPLTDPDPFTDDDEAATSLSSKTPDGDYHSDNDFDANQPSEGPKDDDTSDLEESDTVWQDDCTSFVRIGKFRVNQRLSVERVEYRMGPAVIYPILRTPTAIVVNLVNTTYRDPSTHQLYSLNTIIMNADNDSWEWLGGSRKTVKIIFEHGKKAIDCNRIRYRCKGAPACSQLDPALRSVQRFELDPAPRNTVIAAQQETRRREGNTQEERVAIFLTHIRGTKCLAIDSLGNKCRGGPVLKAKREGSSHGQQYFVGCSGWTPKFRQNHRFHNIPDNVDENLLANALAGRPLSDDRTKDTPPCTGIVHPHTGLRKKTCPHAHIVNGMQVRGTIQAYPCDAQRTIFVPADSSILKVLIVHNATGHNHPMPALTKVSFGHKDTYRQCIKANGVLGATVAKVDNAPSTIQLLQGKTLAAHAPPLHNKHVKQDLLHAAKLEKYPNGLGVEAIRPIFHAELTKPLPERYIHSYVETKKGEKIIVTFVPYLLKLLDDPGVTSFDGDATYKGIEGKLNEWELSIFAKVVQRAASILRAYIDGASTDFFEALFDELQRVKLMVTAKPIPLKKFVRGGNLLVANLDMDGAQAISLCRSVMKYNDVEYSGIANDTPPEEIASEFIKLCWRHGKEPIHDFKSLVSAEQYARIQDVFYIDSKESLQDFSTFIYGLGHKKISDWWRHKEMHAWIIPSIVKSQSRIPADVWDSTPSTTNTNEAQHHWTNSQTGIRLTPVEALESRRQVDENVAQEIKMSLETGILPNHNNELSHRMARNGQRQSAAARRARESSEASDISKDLQLKIAASIAATKSLKEQLKATKPTDASRRRARGQTRLYKRGSPSPTILRPPPTHQEAPPPPADCGQTSVDHTFGFEDNDFDSFLASLGGAETDLAFFAQDTSMGQLSSYDPALDPTIFGFAGDDFNALIPTNAGLPFAAPFDESAMIYGYSGAFPDTTTPSLAASTGSFARAVPFESQLPSLPPPPSDSPPAAEPRTGTIQKSRRVRKEVDEANIITSTRSRAPTARKRLADGEDSEQPRKKAKST
ncbi:hypothetical protein DFH06DRAFT_1417176 [Mycena polygramma]|nr:hypothetical protein DFH06DRAFT_1417176 [Mycena polygramma]